MYGKYGYDPSAPRITLSHHISMGRPLNYHSIPGHLYWKGIAEEELRLGLRPSVAELTGSRDGNSCSLSLDRREAPDRGLPGVRSFH